MDTGPGKSENSKVIGRAGGQMKMARLYCMAGTVRSQATMASTSASVIFA